MLISKVLQFYMLTYTVTAQNPPGHVTPPPPPDTYPKDIYPPPSTDTYPLGHIPPRTYTPRHQNALFGSCIMIVLITYCVILHICSVRYN